MFGADCPALEEFFGNFKNGRRGQNSVPVGVERLLTTDLSRHCGAQERSVPSRNGCVADAFAGRQIIQAGAALDGADGDAAADDAPASFAAAPPPWATVVDEDADAAGPAGAVALVCADPETAGTARSDTAMPSRLAIRMIDDRAKLYLIVHTLW
jgi:hypothetical protein